MIRILDEEIDKFLLSIPHLQRKSLNQIKRRYSSTVTDNLSKGHLTTNVCMITASLLKRNPKELANELQKELVNSNKFEEVECAGPGFINITLKREDFVSIIENINVQSLNFGSSDHGRDKSIQIEFVSANPTGPLHVGHGRGAAYGDAIARILKSSGYDVQKEYYINDAGRQIDILTASVLIKIFEEEFLGYFPKNAYKGSYIIDIAQLFKKKHIANSLNDSKALVENLPQEEEKEIDELILRIKNKENIIWESVKSFALNEVLQTIRTDLKNFNVSFDNWFSESSLGDISNNDSKLSAAILSLKNTGHAYEENGAIWLNTSHAGDDKNRVLIRDDGRATYFASDVAYHKDKIDRGFDKLINVWGADHHGYIKRIEASMNGLGFDEEKLYVQLVQFANLFKHGKKIKMSTRSGEFFFFSRFNR
jgi:arginyl-tRNA synthetase